LITPLATSPTRPPSAPNHTFIPTIASRSLLSREISGSIASYGPPLSVLVNAYAWLTKKK
jgi:hypothetical protein